VNGAIRQIKTDKVKTGDQKQREIDNLMKTRNQLFKAAAETLPPDKIKSLKRRIKDFE